MKTRIVDVVGYQGNSMRLFFGIKLPELLQGSVNSLIKKLKVTNHKANVRWTRPENLHLTLQFLGSLTATQMITLQREVKKQVQGVMPFMLTINSVALFPSEKRPKVLALQIDHTPELSHLVQQIQKAIKTCAMNTDERHFIPHITIGRAHHSGTLLHMRLLPFTSVSFEVNSFSLFESIATDDGRIYQQQEQIHLTAEQEYDYFDHEADIGIIGRGNHLEWSFIAAAKAMFAIMTDLKAVQPVETESLEFIESDIEIALVTWLNLLINRGAAKNMVFCEFQLTRQHDKWQGIAKGEKWHTDLERGTEVKGATLTQLSVLQKGHIWEARCVVDV